MQTQIIERVIEIGKEKTSKKSATLITQAVMAGMFIGLGGILSVTLGFGFPGATAENPALQRLLSGLAFPLGLFLIVLFGGELFTGNNALLMPALRRRHYGPGAVVANWTMVWLANFAGVLLFTYLFVAASGLADAEPYNSALQKIALTKAQMPLSQVFLRGIAANWCVCLAVWLGLSAKTLGGKALACWIPVGTFVILGYEHSIANMFFIPGGMMAGADISFGGLFGNLLVATAGNIVGGSLLVGLFFHNLYAPKK